MSEILYPLNDQIGSVALVQHVGDDKSIVNAALLPEYGRVIAQALSERYSVCLKTGQIYGPKGKLCIRRRGNQRYPTVSLHLLDGTFLAAPAHKVVAFALYGEKAFQSGIVVRHLDGNTTNITPENLVLGSHSENNLDKNSNARSDAARKARQAQGSRPFNATLNEQQVRYIREVCLTHLNKNGRLIKGVAKNLAEEFNLTNAAISAIWKGRNYADIL